MEKSEKKKTFRKRETEENDMEQKGLQKINLTETSRRQATEENSEEAARKKELLRERVERIYHSLHLRP